MSASSQSTTVDKKRKTSAMALNRPLVLLAGFCFVLHVFFYGAHARPEADTSKQGHTLSGSNDNEVKLVERACQKAPCGDYSCCPNKCKRNMTTGRLRCRL
ncbi:hypothetical protein V1264_016226 [Littorina saxatilis]|uniref:Uncharacterized protein n=1 Tax=Littorina saxatilis TaxID=31220 RepID=A0AAN9BLH2_9CAEN